MHSDPSFSLINKAKKTNSYKQTYVEPYVLVFEYNERKAKEICNILNFTKLDIKWAQFIINNRNGFEYMNTIGSHFHNINQKYDIVQGSIADNAEETDGSKCLLVKLNDTDAAKSLRDAAKLEGHPERIGMTVYVNGLKKANYGLPGIREIDAFKVEE